VGRRHKRLKSRLGCAVTEPALTGAAQPECSGQPKGWYGESKEEGVFLFGFVGYRGVWAYGLLGYWKQIEKKEKNVTVRL
jgi:hypothetical protein